MRPARWVDRRGRIHPRGPKKEKVAKTATFCPAYGHTGSRPRRTDWGGMGGHLSDNQPTRLAGRWFLAGRRFFDEFWGDRAGRPDDNAGGAAGANNLRK